MPRRHADGAANVSAKMALIEKPGFGGDFTERTAESKQAALQAEFNFHHAQVIGYSTGIAFGAPAIAIQRVLEVSV